MNNDTTLVATNAERIEPIVPMSRAELMRVFVIGLAAGLVALGAYMLLKQYVFDRAMCTTDASATCAQSPTYSMIVSMVLSALVTLVALVQSRTFRPLLVVIAASIALWGFERLLVSALPWYLELVLGAVLFGLVYLLFAWVVRIRSFIVAAIVALVLAIAVQLVAIS